MSNEKLVALAKKVSEGKADMAELALYNAVCESYQQEQKAWLGMELDLPKMEAESLVKFWGLYSGKTVVKIWPKIAATAAVVLLLGFGYWFYQHRYPHTSETVFFARKGEVTPAKNRAILRLANGERTVSTPRGGIYQLSLPDGTRVWLNAGTTIKYPASFARQKHRKVQMVSGEAYFEVRKDKDHPFIVNSSGQEVEVLGTRFNINIYEGHVKTTLFEGSVKVSQVLPKGPAKGKSKGNNNITLKPGEESVVFKNSLKVHMADREKALAWKNGNFMFNNDDLKTVMHQISYWYDVDVIYEGPKPSMKLSGVFKRKNKLPDVLSLLELTGVVKFRVDGRRVYVRKADYYY